MICSGRFGIVLFVVFSVSLAVMSFPFRNGNAQYRRRMCDGRDGVEEVTDNSTCNYGVLRNPCGKLSCLEGVGGVCDEPNKPFRFNVCAEGLLCMCGKCVGCLRGRCYNELCHNGSPSKRMYSYPVEYSNNYNNYNNYNEY